MEKKEYKSAEEFVSARFAKKTASVYLLTSFGEKSTIAGENSIDVLARMRGTSGLIQATMPLFSVIVISESSPTSSAIAVLRYHHSYPDYQGWCKSHTL